MWDLEFSWKGAPSSGFLSKLRQEAANADAGAGFLSLPDTLTVEDIVSYTTSLKGLIKNYCVIGIGGSAVPARALQGFFRAHRAPASSSDIPRFWILDTTDPGTLREAFGALLAKPKESLFHVISKSGATLETDLIRRHISQTLERTLPLEWKKQFVVTTTPGRGNRLYQWASRNRIRFFELDQAIGGRFSSLSPVAYLSGGFLGLDLTLLTKGAREALEHLEPAARYAELLMQGMARGRKIAAFFLYGDEMIDFGELLIQLFAESLGKSGKGLTPVKFIGPRDQHSVLQLYLDGPKDKMVTILSLHKGLETEIHRAFWAAQEGVYAGLKECHVPVWRVLISKNTPQVYGQLVQFFHLTVVALSLLLGVNPYDQPKVELQKRLTNSFLKKKALLVD